MSFMMVQGTKFRSVVLNVLQVRMHFACVCVAEKCLELESKCLKKFVGFCISFISLIYLPCSDMETSSKLLNYE